MPEITTQGSVPTGLAGGIIAPSRTAEIVISAAVRMHASLLLLPASAAIPVQQCHSQEAAGGMEGDEMNGDKG